ncbi:ABC transporter permease [Microvirga massiliensis]|uniref:ABC transporter permease n=1 Tax=Microvirga massiliensis TaxID=1033741 RepID=UPI0009E37C77|nr:ABC transporter permease [Microvirga massiliensis]
MTSAAIPHDLPATGKVGSALLGGNRLYWLLLILPCLFLGLFYVLPVINVLVMSVTVPRAGIENYSALFSNAAVQRVLLTTLRISVVTTAITLVLGYGVAYALVHSGPRERKILFAIILASFWISALIRAFAWVAILQSAGLINSALTWLGIIDTPLQLVRNELGVMIGMVHYMLPYAILPLYANMSGIDRSLVPAARALGATPFQAFRWVFLPMSMPGVIGAGVIVLIFSLGFYITPAILGGGKTIMIAEYISIQISETLRWGLAAMLASTLLAGVLLLVLWLSRFMDLETALKK